ncbi:ATP-dependent DNA ligase [Bradyrhizobium japonicum]|uniref:hypothetical protein n=1 Tax=Bradyrhizobium liaoningense TaxID=43992 RepID=UPI00289CCD93|nr:hypothetical protein [Bradyrhizobium liaoningense]
MRVERNGKTVPVRLFTRNGHDWTRQFPWIVEAALKNREPHLWRRPRALSGLQRN